MTSDIALSGAWSGDEPGWTDRRVNAWVCVFLVLGVAMRLLRYGLKYPLWGDEAFLASNLIDRDFLALMKPLSYQQVCPLLFLWAEKAMSLLLGFNEWSLRLLPTIASIAGLFLFRHVAGRMIKGVALVIAIAILSIGYTPIRHGGEIKPYASDFLVALGLIALAIEWVRTPERVGFLWCLAALGPFAVAFSNPSIFIAASIGLVLTIPVLKSRSLKVMVPFAIFGIATVGSFLLMQKLVNSGQSASVMEWMRVYWAGSFPPRAFLPFLGWMAKTHTSQMFAYPAGGDLGASTLTTGLVLAAIIAYLRRGSKTVLAILLVPFVLGLIASFLGRYPYGGSARTMQYVAPSIILMAGLGAAVLLSRLPRPDWRERAPRLVMGILVVVGLGMMGWDVAHPYKLRFDQTSRDFARRFWIEESANAELVCAKTDLHLGLDQLGWQGDRAAMYLCHQAIYSNRHHNQLAPKIDKIDAEHPLRVVVFGERDSDAPAVNDWIAKNTDRFELKSKRERVLNKGVVRGKASYEDRYVVYDFVPRQVAVSAKKEPMNR